MGIHNRDYYRDKRGSGYHGSLGLDALTPVVKFLLFANIVVFLAQIFIVREEKLTPRERIRRYNPALERILAEKEAEGPEAFEAFKKKNPEFEKMLDEDSLANVMHPPVERISIVQEWFALETDKVVYSGQVWRLLTHAFCHDRTAPWHIFFNMLLLYWFGLTLESMYGSREFLLFYLTAAVFAGLAFVALDLYTGSSRPGIGASGAVMAVVMLYTWHYPHDTIRVFWVWPIEMRYIVVLYALFDLHPLLLTLAGDRVFTDVAHAAHLGGLLFGFLYAHYEWRLEGLTERIAWPRWRRRPRLRIAAPPRRGPEPERDEEMSRVDEVLQKIYDSGQDSLTDEERAILQSASERLKNRRR
jgi:membrane associated rhomboid family serine protease